MTIEQFIKSAYEWQVACRRFPTGAYVAQDIFDSLFDLTGLMNAEDAWRPKLITIHGIKVEANDKTPGVAFYWIPETKVSKTSFLQDGE